MIHAVHLDRKYGKAIALRDLSFPDWDWEKSRALVGRSDVPRDKVLKEMSAGQRRRAELTLALAQSPDLLVLDELKAQTKRLVFEEALRDRLRENSYPPAIE